MNRNVCKLNHFIEDLKKRPPPSPPRYGPPPTSATVSPLPTRTSFTLRTPPGSSPSSATASTAGSVPSNPEIRPDPSDPPPYLAVPADSNMQVPSFPLNYESDQDMFSDSFDRPSSPKSPEKMGR